MPLSIQNLSFSYNSNPVFTNVSMHFGTGKTALIGPNGAGKSTLIKLILHELRPDAGIISGLPPEHITLCPQNMDMAPAGFSDSDILNDSDFYPLLARLEIKLEWIERWDTLSGGEKKRCMLADVLIRKPALLILDEPANHIDSYTLALLSRSLESFAGDTIIVSHNIAFIDPLCKTTVLLVPGKNGSHAHQWACSPVTALNEFDKDAASRRTQRITLTHSISRIERQKHEAIQSAEQSKKAKLSKRTLDRHDSDGRAQINQAKLTGKDSSSGKKVTRAETELARRHTELAELAPSSRRKTGAGLKGTRSARNVLYYRDAGELVLADGNLTLVHDTLEITNNARIMITGDNGTGKTSLINVIAAEIRLPPCDTFWYLSQELSLAEQRAALDTLTTLDEQSRGAVLSVVYRLGSEVAAVLNTANPSPGEARKLCFAFAMLRGVSLIILDEPTNHLDRTSADAFADAIAEFKGAALIITHDPAFAGKQGHTFWHVESTGPGKSRLKVNAESAQPLPGLEALE